jgi:hypothetical protein
MNLVAISQIAAPILQTIFIVVIGIGYYYSIRVTQTMVQEMREEHTAGSGRPLITVSEDYANLPNMNIIVQNVGQGPAKDITFEFSAPVQSSDGFVLSDLPFFQEGLTSLTPGPRSPATGIPSTTSCPQSRKGGSPRISRSRCAIRIST